MGFDETQRLDGIFVTLGGSFVEPCRRLINILRHATASDVHDSETTLSLGVAAIGGLAEPLDRHCIVACHPIAITINHAETELGSACDFVLNNTGRFDFKYDYGPPRRLNCVLDDTSMGRFDRYLETYRAERAAEKSA